MRFTPRLPDSSERLELDVSEEEHAQVLRGRAWEGTFTNLATGRRYLVRGAACWLPDCFCDAEIVRELPVH